MNIDVSKILRWSKGSCGNSGCKDKSCVCAVCALPIGVPEDDPRWETHPEYCNDCELCVDQVPTMLFSGEGKEMLEATFHSACFERVLLPQNRKGNER
jgi:hypothetical protein